jgi:putative N6-adenine-specific DNA methylase
MLCGLMQWFAVSSPGMQGAVARELSLLPGVAAEAPEPAGVAFSGDLAAGMAANLHLRTATRILLRVGEIKARALSELERKLGTLPFEQVVPPIPAAGIRVEVTAHRCRLYHTGAIAERVRNALPKHADVSLVPTIEPRIMVRGVRDVFTISLDSSGELLHRRGWRTEAGRAPLRETLAAGILNLCEYTPGTTLVDGMCGAGTFAIEAAAMAQKRAPGLGRSFAFESWPNFDAVAWKKLCDAARAQVGVKMGVTIGFDRNSAGIERAKRNAERAGLGDAVRFLVASFEDALPPEGVAPGLVVCNPPYGRRLGSSQVARSVLTMIGERMRGPWRSYGLAIVTPERDAESLLRMRSTAQFELDNGGLAVRLLRFAPS